MLSVFRFGKERLLSIRREYPVRDTAAPTPPPRSSRCWPAPPPPAAGARQRPLHTAARASASPAAAPAGRCAIMAAMLLRGLRWGLAGALVAWTLIRSSGSSAAGRSCRCSPSRRGWRRSRWSSRRSPPGGAGGRARRDGACALLAARAARAAGDSRTGRRRTRRACGCACWRPTSRATTAAGARDHALRPGTSTSQRRAAAAGRSRAYDAAGIDDAPPPPVLSPGRASAAPGCYSRIPLRAGPRPRHALRHRRRRWRAWRACRRPLSVHVPAPTAAARPRPLAP